MTPEQRQLRQLHQSGTRDFSTALALLRAAVDEDWRGMSLIVRGIDEDDDPLGVCIYLAQMAATGLRAAEAGAAGAHEVLDTLARLEQQQCEPR